MEFWTLGWPDHYVQHYIKILYGSQFCTKANIAAQYLCLPVIKTETSTNTHNIIAVHGSHPDVWISGYLWIVKKKNGRGKLEC